MQRIDGAGWVTCVASAPHPEAAHTGSDPFARRHAFAAGTSRYDPGTSPAQDTVLDWATFSEIADDADHRAASGGRAWDKYRVLLGSASQ